MASRIRKGDRVVVLAGRDRGKEGEVLEGAAQGGLRRRSRGS